VTAVVTRHELGYDGEDDHASEGALNTHAWHRSKVAARSNIGGSIPTCTLDRDRPVTDIDARPLTLAMREAAPKAIQDLARRRSVAITDRYMN
jgi:hypothetical protein